jgi:putative ribosome biogenesis GTPase RsgA
VEGFLKFSSLVNKKSKTLLFPDYCFIMLSDTSSEYENKKKAAKKVYLKHVRLRGYRTILDTRIDLEPGLNIIIGKNGVGKSNFLNSPHYWSQ